MQPQTTEQPKLIFGLSPNATFANAIILSVVSSLFWVIKFAQQIPPGTDYSKLQITDNVPWYYDVPFSVLSIVLALTWVEYKYKIPRGSWDWSHVRIKIISVFVLFFIQEISKVLLLITILNLK
jgi:hypothetical protein